MQAVTYLEQFVQLLAEHQHGAALVAQLQDGAAYLRGRPHVHPPGGLGDDEQRGPGIDLAAHDEFLQVAARQRLRRRVGAAGLDVEARNDGARLLLQLAHANPAAFAQRGLAREQQVVRQAHAGHGAAAKTLLRHEVQAQRTAPAGAQAPRLPAGNLHHFGRCARVLAGQRIQQFLLAIARDTGDAHDFARAHIELDALQVHAEGLRARQRQALHAQHAGADLGFAVRELGRLRADHQPRQRGIALHGRIAHAGHLPAAQHGTGRAQRTDLVQLVADVEDGAALGRQAAQHHEELLHRLRREYRGGLVKNEHARVREQGADDFHALHLAHAQRVHGAVGIDLQPVVMRRGLDALYHLGQRQALVQAQPDVLGHGQRVEQAEMLEHHGDAQLARLLRVADVDRLAIDLDAALVGLDGAVDDLHQRGLAGAVLAQDGMHFAGAHGQRDAVVGHHRRIALGDACQLKPRRRCCWQGDCIGGIHGWDCLSISATNWNTSP